MVCLGKQFCIARLSAESSRAICAKAYPDALPGRFGRNLKAARRASVFPRNNFRRALDDAFARARRYPSLTRRKKEGPRRAPKLLDCLRGLLHLAVRQSSAVATDKLPPCKAEANVAFDRHRPVKRAEQHVGSSAGLSRFPRCACIPRREDAIARIGRANCSA